MSNRQDKINNRLDFYKNRDETHPRNLLYEYQINQNASPISASFDWWINGAIKLFRRIFAVLCVTYAYFGSLFYKYSP